MEEFEYETAPQPQKRSPFADSPYVCAVPEEQPVTPTVKTPVVPQKVSAPKQKWGKKILTCVALSLAVAIVTSFVVSGIWQGRMDNMEKAMDEKFQALQQMYDDYKNNVSAPIPEEGPLTPSQIYAKNIDAVVKLTGIRETADGYKEARGTGFLISADGYLLTNHHLIENISYGYAELYGGKVYDFKIVGYEVNHDMAVLKIDAENLPHVTFGSSDALNVGDRVTVIGNHLGELSSTLTVGYVSGKDRIVTSEGVALNLLQTDAALNPGSSGGPVFDVYGQVVGMVSLKLVNTGDQASALEGLGFAVPMDDVKGMIQDLMEYGYISGASLGVMVMDVDAQSQYMGLPAGAFVDSVVAGSAAQKAGIRAGDIIVNLAGYDVDSVATLTRILLRLEAGETVSVTVYRNGQKVYLNITLDEKAPQQNPPVTEPPVNNDLFDDIMDFIFGF